MSRRHPLGRRGRGLAALSLATTAGLLGTYVGSPRLPRAYASAAPLASVFRPSGEGSFLDFMRSTGVRPDERSGLSLRAAPACTASVDDSVALHSAVQSAVDGDIICITHDIPDLTEQLVIDDTTLTLVGAGGSGDDFVTLTADDTRHVLANLSNDSLTIDNLGFEGGFSNQEGGALAVYGQSGITGSYLTVERSAFSGGFALAGGALVARNVSEVEVRESTFSSNFALHGGAIAAVAVNARSNVSILNSTFTDDSAALGGGAVALASYGGLLYGVIAGQVGSPTTFTGHSAGQGGAIWAREQGIGRGLVVGIAGEVTFEDNSAIAGYGRNGYGGAVYLTADDTVEPGPVAPNLLIVGDGNVPGLFTGQPTFSDNAAVSGGAARAAGTVLVGAVPYYFPNPDDYIGAVFTGNQAMLGDGGAMSIDGLVLAGRSAFSRNTAYLDGGAISLDDSAGTPATIEGVAALYSYFGYNTAQYGRGGAISIDSGDGVAYIVQSTLVANFAQVSGGAIDSADGAMLMSNSTLAFNATDDSGGGIHAPNAAASIEFSTIVGNEGGAGGGGVVLDAVTLENSILQGNSADGAAEDLRVTTVADSYSLFTSPTSVLSTGWVPGPGTLLSSATVLGPLQDNGGVSVSDDTIVPTMEPLEGSIVIDAANPDDSGFPATDERGSGFPRVIGGRADMGAVEWTPPEPPPPPPRPPRPVQLPPSAPLDAAATARDAVADVRWSPPESSGTSPVTEYQVQAAPGDATCTAVAPTLTCTVTGLANGTSYTFTVRARSAVGWGPYSVPSAPVTPQAPASPAITIVGSRTEVRGRPGVLVSGTTTGLVGREVTAWVRLAGQTAYRTGATRVVDAEGAFTWQRVTGKKTYAYFTAGDIRSNRVIIPPMPRP
jgi:hypothetical protein